MDNSKMKRSSLSAIILIAGVFFLSAFFITTNSWAFDACDYYYEALIDVDNNPGTGGTVHVVQKDSSADIPGIDYIVRAYLTPATKKIDSIYVLRWNGSGFDAVIHPENYDLGIMNGYQYNTDKADVVEFAASRTDLGYPSGTMKIVYHAMQLTPGSDYTDPFYYGSTAIPTFSEWGMILLSFLFGLSAVWMLRKRKAAIGSLVVLGIVLGISGHAWAPPPPLITLDGGVTDWQSAGVSPSVIDPLGDSSLSDDGEDIVAGYITSDLNNIYFRIDIVGGGNPECGA
jgi:hypothetical protein